MDDRVSAVKLVELYLVDIKFKAVEKVQEAKNDCSRRNMQRSTIYLGLGMVALANALSSGLQGMFDKIQKMDISSHEVENINDRVNRFIIETFDEQSADLNKARFFPDVKVAHDYQNAFVKVDTTVKKCIMEIQTTIEENKKAQQAQLQGEKKKSRRELIIWILTLILAPLATLAIEHGADIWLWIISLFHK